MSKSNSDELDEIKERLADIEHQRWSDWQKYCHQVFKDGKFDEFMPRWERQIDTDYKDLSESEKQSDLDQVDRYWGLILNLIDKARIDELENFSTTLYTPENDYKQARLKTLKEKL